MRITALAATLAVASLAVGTADALDLSPGTSPWQTLATIDSVDGTSPDSNHRSNQAFMRCDDCSEWAASFARGEDIVTAPLPHFDGSVSRFTLKRTTDEVISKGLQAKFPDVQTYYGRNADGVTVELDSSLAGGVRVQYHAARGGMSYLDHVRADDPDMAMVSDNVRAAVQANAPVFRVYQQQMGKRASEALGTPEFTCATRPNKRPKKNKVPNKPSTQAPSRGEYDANCTYAWMGDNYCDPVNNVEG
jgi:hypothetical protein